MRVAADSGEDPLLGLGQGDGVLGGGDVGAEDEQAELDPFTTDSVIGGAVGYQAFWDNKRRNLIMEVAGRHDLSGDGFDSIGIGAQLQQAIGRHVQLTFETFYAFNEGRHNGSGARAEIQVVY